MNAQEIDALKEKVEKAIDAIIDLEGTPVFPYGLTSSLRSALQELRLKDSRLLSESDAAHEAENDAKMIKNVVEGALAAPAAARLDTMTPTGVEDLDAMTVVACRPHLRKKYFCVLTINNKPCRCQVMVTSKPRWAYGTHVYVKRLVKSTGRWGNKRYEVVKADIEEVLV